MHLLRRHRAAIAAVTLSAIALSGCAPAGLASVPATQSSAGTVAPSTASPAATASVAATSVSPSSPAPASTSSEATQETSTPEATATPEDLTALKPGTNHSWAAAKAGYVYPASTVNAWLSGRKKRPEKKIVFLTFDDGPNPQTSHVILDALKKGKVHASFFVVGSQVDAAPEILKRQIAEGHSVGLHSWSHDYTKLYPGRKGNTHTIMGEYHRTLNKVRSVLGDDFFSQSWRYPGGHMSWTHLEGADKALKEQGVTWIDWNSDTRDSAPVSERPTTVEATVKNATQQIREGYHVIVVLGHDTHEKKLTSQSVGAMVKAFKKAGYEFGTIS